MASVVAASVTVVAVALVACGRSSTAAAGDRPRRGTEVRNPRLRSVRSFAFALGVDPLDHRALARLGRYDLVAVDGSATRAQVAALHRRGALVLGYLSVGTVEPYRPWFATARRHHWLLDHWAEWDEWYADVSAPGFRAVLVREARRQVAIGFDGLFLDNTDMVDGHPAQAAGMRDAVADLDRAIGPHHLLFSQNGDHTVARIQAHLDGWNREDVTSTYDDARHRYALVGRADHRQALATLARLRRRGLLVTTADYVAHADDPAAAAAVRSSCRAGALPFVADIDLTRIPAPVTCPG